MLKTTKDRNNESSERICLRSAAQTFTNVIAKGTNCSRFEAAVISEKAQEIFHLGEYKYDHQIQPGQLVWRAISEEEPPGKALKECKFKTVRLTVHSLEEDREILSNYGHSTKRGNQIIRITQEALDQGTLLTQEDLATILDCDIKTIRNDIKKHQQEYNILIPTRGNKKHIGPGMTHRDKAVELFIQGKDALSIARAMKHSLKSIERYTQTFCRFVHAQNQLKNSLKNARVGGVSVPAVNRYLAIRDKHWKTIAFQERLSEIEEVGSRFWYYQDSKKKSGRKSRRTK